MRTKRERGRFGGRLRRGAMTAAMSVGAVLVCARPPRAVAEPDVAVTGLAQAHTWQAAFSFQDALGGEYLEYDQRELVTHATKAKLALVAEPHPGVLLAATLLGKHYAGATTVPVAGYLPAETHALLVPANPATGTPGTADVLTYHLADTLTLHEAYGEARGERLRLRAGRQLYGVGAGKAFRPTDLFNFTYPGDPMWEPVGHDGLLLAATLPWSLHLEGFVELGPRLAHTNGIARASAALAGWQVGASFTRHWSARTDWQALNTPAGLAAVASGGRELLMRDFRWDQLAGEATGSLAGVDVRAEAGFAFVRAPSDVGTLAPAAENHLRLLLGADHTFASGTSALCEYMYLGQGRTRASAIDFDDRLALLAGEVLTISRHAAFFTVGQDVATRFTVGVRGVAAAMDPVNVMLFPFVTWRMLEGATMDVYGSLPIGPQRGLIGNAGPGVFMWLKFDLTAGSS